MDEILVRFKSYNLISNTQNFNKPKIINSSEITEKVIFSFNEMGVNEEEFEIAITASYKYTRLIEGKEVINIKSVFVFHFDIEIPNFKHTFDNAQKYLNDNERIFFPRFQNLINTILGSEVQKTLINFGIKSHVPILELHLQNKT
ncbi:hypothetical protein [Snodgrassella sp. ESL0253]|uniref:hypothetical protein n=1 Tax=Snodgrassella sp. ESL0253 TaxID=2705031 RepID=UPI001583557C|nr:hypothetical protein [Snodgrassella sp. ESL0253]NUE66948.1 hypothetical protein [Snodgrassella sp. ESL0253]